MAFGGTITPAIRERRRHRRFEESRSVIRLVKKMGEAPVARWVQDAERMKAIHGQWADYAAGKLKPKDRSERRLLTLYCVRVGRPRRPCRQCRSRFPEWCR